MHDQEDGAMLKVTTDSERLRSRIENWKFDQAKAYLKGQPKEVRGLVEALARLFGDTGWIGGDLGICIQAVVDKLLGE